MTDRPLKFPQTYYVQRAASGYVGDCMILWRKGGHGYTIDLGEAEVFSEEQVKELLSGDRDKKFIAWPIGYLNECAQRMVTAEAVDFSKGVTRESAICQKTKS